MRPPEARALPLPDPESPVVDRLLLWLARVGRTPDEDEWIGDALRRVEDPERFFALAHDNRVAPRVCRELERLGLFETLPGPVRQRFRDEAARVAVANRRRLEGARPVLRELVDRGVGVVVLKGVAFGATLYGDPAYKRMNDLDLLVRRTDVGVVREVYAAHGFFPIAERDGGDPERQLQVTHHLPPYVDRALSCLFGTQWDFRSPLLGHDFDLDAVWGRTVPLVLEGVAVRTLGPEDALHHVALHLERFRTGVRDVMDLHNLVFAHPGLDWELFRRLVEAAGTHDDVYYALSFAQAHRPHPEVAATLARLAPMVRARVRRLVAERTRSERVLVRICSCQFSTIEKTVSAFDATWVWREKAPLFLKGWGAIFWPSRDDARKISAIVDQRPMAMVRARIVAPWRLCVAIAEEIGGWLLLGLAIKSVVDLGRAAWPFGEKRDLEGYARRLGIDLEALKAAEEHLQ